ncbi:TetR/AcrR family transcriptional regulator [Caulobacter sp. S45]|uniref:TetR/AcrR family transcriptional regulator n=1 Tax=Caulobacter sp. S45 TaxID=1641861 RepID=UPI0015773331|nr:TetR/AcrR family transcriptional regulator [Caulobacter sp. S45]
MDDGCARSLARDTRRQAILEVARQVFMEDGFAAASMSAIASRVGGSKGTLYNYFPSKHELFAAVIQNECDLKQVALFDGLEASGDDVVAVLREVGRRYTQLVLGEQVVVLTRVVIAESTRFPELGRVLYEAGPKRGRVRMAAYVTGQMAAGRLRQGDPMRMVDQFCDMCMSVLYRQRLMNVVDEPDEQMVADNVEAAIEVILAAYGPAGAASSTTS